MSPVLFSIQKTLVAEEGVLPCLTWSSLPVWPTLKRVSVHVEEEWDRNGTAKRFAGPDGKVSAR